MSSYLVVNNQSCKCYPFANAPYMVVDKSYIPMTSITSTDMPRATNSSASYQVTSYRDGVENTDTMEFQWTVWTGTSHGSGTQSMYITLESALSTQSNTYVDGTTSSDRDMRTVSGLAIDVANRASFTLYNSEAPSEYQSSVSANSKSAAWQIVAQTNSWYTRTLDYASSVQYLVSSDYFTNDTISLSNSDGITEYCYSEYVQSSTTSSSTTSKPVAAATRSETISRSISEYIFTALGGAPISTTSISSNDTFSVSSTTSGVVTYASSKTPGQITSTTFTGYSGTYTRSTGTYTASAYYTGSRSYSSYFTSQEGRTVYPGGRETVTTASTSGVSYYNNLGFPDVVSRTAYYVSPLSPTGTSVTLDTHTNARSIYIQAQTLGGESESDTTSMSTLRLSQSTRTQTYSNAAMLNETHATTTSATSTYSFGLTYPVTNYTTASFTLTSSESNATASQTFSATQAVLGVEVSYTQSDTTTTEDYTRTYTQTTEGVTSWFVTVPAPAGDIVGSGTASLTHYSYNFMRRTYITSWVTQTTATNFYLSFNLATGNKQAILSVEGPKSSDYTDNETYAAVSFLASSARSIGFNANRSLYTADIVRFTNIRNPFSEGNQFAVWEYDTTLQRASGTYTLTGNITCKTVSETARYNYSAYTATTQTSIFYSSGVSPFISSTSSLTATVTETVSTTTSEQTVVSYDTYLPLPEHVTESGTYSYTTTWSNTSSTITVTAT